MPSSAVATKTWFRPKGWFTDREVGIVVNRVLRDDPEKGDMHNREGITPKSLFRSLKDYDMWIVRFELGCTAFLCEHADSIQIYALGLLCFIPSGTPSTYLTLSLRNLGFSTVSIIRQMAFRRCNTLPNNESQFETNLLVIPSQAIAICNLLLLTFFSEWAGERLLIAMIQNLWCEPIQP